MVGMLLVIIVLESVGLIFLIYRNRNIDGRIFVSDNHGEVIWNIQTRNPDKVAKANGQIVRFKVVNGNRKLMEE